MARELALFILLPSSFFLSPGCAVVPRGPVASHERREYSGRADGLVLQETWRDSAFTRGLYVFADPSLNKICAWHTNQLALGGGSRIMAGGFSLVVDTNLVPAIAAAGTAAGNVIAASVKSAIK